MHVAALRHSSPLQRLFRKYVAIDDGHALKEVAQDPGGAKTRHASADYDCVLVSHRSPPAESGSFLLRWAKPVEHDVERLLDRKSNIEIAGAAGPFVHKGQVCRCDRDSRHQRFDLTAKLALLLAPANNTAKQEGQIAGLLGIALEHGWMRHYFTHDKLNDLGMSDRPLR